MKIITLAEGIITADGSEQIILEELDGPGIISGYICTCNMETGDDIVVRAHVWVNTHYGLYAQNSYSGLQPEPVLRFNGIRYKDKLKITLEQTAGTYRNFDYEFVKEVS